MHRTLATAVVAAALGLAPCPLRADDAGADPDEVRQGGEILVRDQRLRPVEVFQDSAIETEWVTEEEFAALPGTDAAAVVDHLAGIRTSQRIQGQEAAVAIEGMQPEYTRILVDGQRFSGEVGGVGDLSDVSLVNVERIEVLRGSQGARYGTDAAGGVINLVTKSAPDDGFRMGAQGEGGDDSRALGGGFAAYRLGPLGLSLSGEYDRIDGFDAPADDDVVLAAPGGEDSRDRSHFLYGRWDAPVFGSVTLRGNGLWRVEDDEFVTAAEGGAGGVDDSSPRKDTNWRGNLGFDWLAGDGTTIATDVTYYAIDTDSKVGREFGLFEDEWSADLAVDHYFATGPVAHAVQAGTELDWQSLDLDEGALPESIDNEELEAQRDIDEAFFTPSLYLLTESAITDWFSLVLGVRGKGHSEFDARVLPQAGVLVKPIESLKLRASWGLNYRTPSLRDLYQPPTPQLGGAYFLSGNPDLEPEDSMSVRAGFEWSPVSWLSLASAGFFHDVDDFIRSEAAGEISIGRDVVQFFPEDLSSPEIAFCEAQRVFFPDPGDWTPECEAFFSGAPIEREVLRRAPLFEKENLDSVRTWGAESQVRLRIGPQVRIAADYTWMRTHVVDSSVDTDELPNEPEHSVSVRATLIAPRTDTELTSAWRWRSGVIPEGSGTGLLAFADDSDTTPPSYQVDFRVAQPLLGKLRVYFDAFNVTDERREDSYAIRGFSWVVGISGELGSPE
jgi:outer membrane receptor protein involved in Fe transport